MRFVIYLELVLALLFLSPLISSVNAKTVENPSKLLDQLKLETVEVSQGHTKLLRLPVFSNVQKLEFKCDDLKIPLFEHQGELKGYLREGNKAVVRNYDCQLSFEYDGKKESRRTHQVKVIAFDFPHEKLKVAKKNVDISQKNLKRYLKDKEALKTVFEKNITDKALFDTAFSNPLDSMVTGVFGTRRIFNNKKESIHLGVDFRAPEGTPILATNDGLVVFSGDLFFNGMTVIIDHGVGVMSMYCHLSKLEVPVDRQVKKGQVIGLSGKTGRSTGPHLHWGIKMHGEWIDGLSLVQAGI